MATTIVLKNMTGNPIVLKTLGGLSVGPGGGTLSVVPAYFTEVDFWDLYADEIKAFVDNGSLRMVVDGVEYTDATEGDKWADPITKQDLSEMLFKVTNDPTGFPNRTESALTWTNTSPDRTLSIAPTGTSFSYYIKGIKYTKSVAQSVQIDDTEGMWYVYFNGATLVASQAPAGNIYYDYAMVAIVYWDAANKVAIVCGDERHGVSMPWSLHEYLHKNFGMRYGDGLTVTPANPTIPQQTGNADNGKVGVDSGHIWDEDIYFTVGGLASPATIPILYRSGINGYWRRTTNTGYPYPLENSVPAYNRLNAGSWDLYRIASNDFVNIWICATSCIINPIIAVVGQTDHATLTAAQAATFGGLTLGSLPFNEIRPLYKIILCNKFSPNFPVQEITDLRATSTVPGGSVATSQNHNALAGRNAVDSHPETAIQLNATGYSFTAAESATFTGTSFATGLTRDTVVFVPPATGNYLLEWGCESGGASNTMNRGSRYHVTQNGSEILGNASTILQAFGTAVTQYSPWCGKIVLSLTAGVSYTFVLEFCSVSGSNQRVKNTFLKIGRLP